MPRPRPLRTPCIQPSASAVSLKSKSRQSPGAPQSLDPAAASSWVPGSTPAIWNAGPFRTAQQREFTWKHDVCHQHGYNYNRRFTPSQSISPGHRPVPEADSALQWRSCWALPSQVSGLTSLVPGSADRLSPGAPGTQRPPPVVPKTQNLNPIFRKHQRVHSDQPCSSKCPGLEEAPRLEETEGPQTNCGLQKK